MAAQRIPVVRIVKLVSDCINNGVRWTSNPTYHHVWRSGIQRGCSTEVKHSSSAAGAPPSPEVLNQEGTRNTEVENISKQLDIVSEKLNEVEDKYKRVLAESDNIRKRFMKQVEDAKLFSIQGFCKDLVEVAEVLGKAMESVPKEEIKDSNPHLKSLYEGLQMTEAHLHSVFKRHGLVPVNPLNEKFDPHLHEALFQQDVPGKEPGTVIAVSKVGFKLHQRVIRPALVGVAKSS